jgi:type IV pilus assembly protein PilA
MNSKKGFTLIELLVVIAIIGILSSIVIASLSSARRRGRDSAILGQLKQLQTQSQIFYEGNGQSFSPAGAASSTTANCIAGANFPTSFFASTTAAGGQIALIATNDPIGSNVKCTTSANGQLWAISVDFLNNSTSGVCVDNSGAFRRSVGIFAQTSGTCS